MHVQKNYKVFIFFFLFFVIPIHASNTLILTNQSERESIEKKLWYLSLPNQASYYEVIDKNSSFMPIREKKNFGYHDNSIWLRLRIQNRSNTTDWVLYSSVPILDYMELFDSATIISPLIGDRYKERFHYPSSRYPYFHLHLKPHETRLFYIRIQTSGLLFVDFKLQRATSFFHETSEENFFYGLYFGALLSLAVFIFITFLVKRKKSFLFYSLLTLCFATVNFILTGYSYRFFYDSFFSNELLLIVSLLLILFSLMLTTSIHQHREKDSSSFSLDSFFYLFKATILIVLPFVFWWNYSKIDITMNVILLLSLILIAFALFKSFKQEKIFVTLVFFAILLLLLSVAKHLLYFNYLPSYLTIMKDQTELLSLVGFAVLTFALFFQEEKAVQTQNTDKDKALQKLETELHKQKDQLVEYQTEAQDTQNIVRSIHKKIPVENFMKQKRINIVPTFISVEQPRGDFYKIHQPKSNCYRFFLADTTGMGAQAVLASLAVKTEYQSLKDVEHLGAVVRTINNNFVEKFSHLNVFFTCLLLEIDLEKNKIFYVSAGHPKQIVMDKFQTHFLEHSAKLIGFSKQMEYQVKEISLKNNSRVFLFTKGITEEQDYNRERFGELKLYQSFDDCQSLPLQESVQKTLVTVKSFTQQEKFQNDITLIAIDINVESFVF